MRDAIVTSETKPKVIYKRAAKVIIISKGSEKHALVEWCEPLSQPLRIHRFNPMKYGGVCGSSGGM